jgi:putative ABC transport system permease protein
VHTGQLILRNTLRAPLRTAMTVLTVAVMLSAFVFPRALVTAQRSQIDQAEANRLVVKSRRGWGHPMPARYAEDIRHLDGVRTASGSRFVSFKVPGKEDQFFTSYGTEAKPMLEIHAHQMVAPLAEREAFVNDLQGVMLSRDVAKRLGWKLGDHVTVESWEFPGRWELNVRAIFDPHHAEWSRDNLVIHYEYLNLGLPIEAREQMAIIAVEVLDPARAGDIAKNIDRTYDASHARTMTLQDRVQLIANIGQFQAILRALDVVSFMILAVVLSILGNTLAMNTRERTRELAVLRAIGFSSRRIVVMVLAEAALIGLAGAALGLAIAYPLLQGLVGPILQDNMSFPPLTIPLGLALSSLVSGAALATASAGWPAYRLTRAGIAESMGRVV